MLNKQNFSIVISEKLLTKMFWVNITVTMLQSSFKNINILKSVKVMNKIKH